MLPFRGSFGDPRPAALAELALPPRSMPSHEGTRPLKAWRYVGVYGPEVMLCLGAVRVGPLRQSFWALWDREERRLDERTLMGRREVSVWPGGAAIRSGEVRVDLRFEEVPGVETISPSGTSYAWTRKQGGVLTSAKIVAHGVGRELQAYAVIDDSAGYHARHTSWRWSAGVGRSVDGRDVAWNLVDGLHDAPTASERTVWIDGQPREVAPVSFASDLRQVAGLRFEAEAERVRREDLLILRSVYRQPFGVFGGELPGGIGLADGYGVMESHEATW